MDARGRVLAVDFSLAAGAASVGALWTGGSPVWAAGISIFGAGVLVYCLYLAEQTPLLEFVERHSPRSHLAAFALTLAVGLVLVVGWTVVVSPAASLLLGMGVGLACYRLVYGVLEPVPEKRLAQADPRQRVEIDPPTGQS